jgi:hypothetical protein
MTSSRMSVEEALFQLKDNTLMLAAMIAYNQARLGKGVCEDCCLRLGDTIRSLMRPQQ